MNEKLTKFQREKLEDITIYGWQQKAFVLSYKKLFFGSVSVSFNLQQQYDKWNISFFAFFLNHTMFYIIKLVELSVVLHDNLHAYIANKCIYKFFWPTSVIDVPNLFCEFYLNIFFFLVKKFMHRTTSNEFEISVFFLLER